MRLSEILTKQVDEAKPSKSYCEKTRKSAMSASWAASCKSRGLTTRDGKKSHKIGSKRVTVGNKKIKGADYGGPLPDWDGK